MKNEKEKNSKDKSKKKHLNAFLLFFALTPFLFAGCGFFGEYQNNAYQNSSYQNSSYQNSSNDGYQNGQVSDEANAEPTYTIKYVDNKGGHTISVKFGDTYMLDEIPYKEGYSFLGLFDAEEGGNKYVSSSGISVSPFIDEENLVLFPQFEVKNYTLVLDYQGAEITGERSVEVVYEERLLSLPTEVKIPHKEFVGWYTRPNCQGIKVCDRYGVIPDKAIINSDTFNFSKKDEFLYLYAGFEPEECMVIFFLSTDVEPELIYVDYGTRFEALDIDYSVNGMKVYSWSTEYEDIERKHLFSGRIVENKVLYACEFATTIVFDSQGGTSIEPISKRGGDPVLLPIPEKNSYVFAGWKTSDGRKYTSGEMPYENITLFAEWQPMIIFNENGGSRVADISAPAGEKVNLPVTDRVGYVFAGWYDSFGNKVEDNIMPEKSVTLSAKYYKWNSKLVTFSDDMNNSDYYAKHNASVSELYDNGIKNVEVTVHFDYCSSYPETEVTFTAYSQDKKNDAYLLMTCSAKRVESDRNVYCSYTFSEEIELTSGMIYFYISPNKYNSYTYIENKWLEIKYIDTTRLY